MRLHYMGTYNLDPDSLPHGEHKKNAVPFKEAKDSKEMAIIGNVGAIIITIILMIIVSVLFRKEFADNSFWGIYWQFLLPCILFFAALIPHEILHAVCFKEDVYLYTNLKQGLLFVVGSETMSKSRFVFLSLLPNVVLGLIPYVLGICVFDCMPLAIFGALALGGGFGDYYNVFNALTQMPKGARTYLYKFNSFWYMPEEKNL